jgi:hypothetical protein
MSALQFYLERAAEAEATTLARVRERCRRSEEAWSELAEKARQHEALKAAEQQRKTELSA